MYETATVARGRVAAAVTASGTLSALVTVDVGSQVSGRVLALHADFNSQVKKGQADARRSRLAAWALAVALFAAGVAAGVAVDRLLVAGAPRPVRPGPPTSAELVARMTRDLELTGAQAGAIRAILDERWEALSTLSARFEPEAEEIRRAADDRIRATLDPGQRERFEQRVAEPRALIGRPKPSPDRLARAPFKARAHSSGCTGRRVGDARVQRLAPPRRAARGAATPRWSAP